MNLRSLLAPRRRSDFMLFTLTVLLCLMTSVVYFSFRSTHHSDADELDDEGGSFSATQQLLNQRVLRRSTGAGSSGDDSGSSSDDGGSSGSLSKDAASSKSDFSVVSFRQRLKDKLMEYTQGNSNGRAQGGDIATSYRRTRFNGMVRDQLEAAEERLKRQREEQAKILALWQKKHSLSLSSNSNNDDDDDSTGAAAHRAGSNGAGGFPGRSASSNDSRSNNERDTNNLSAAAEGIENSLEDILEQERKLALLEEHLVIAFKDHQQSSLEFRKAQRLARELNIPIEKLAAAGLLFVDKSSPSSPHVDAGGGAHDIEQAHIVKDNHFNAGSGDSAATLPSASEPAIVHVQNHAPLLPPIAPSPSLELVIGITNGKREIPTILDTLDSLLPWIDPAKHKIVVWRAHNTKDDGLASVIVSKAPPGVIALFQPSEPYPEILSPELKLTHNDTLDRVRWRSSHALDYANLVRACHRYGAPFTLILEDDVEVAKNFTHKLSAWLRKYNFGTRKEWGAITLYSDHTPVPGVDNAVTPIDECQCGAVALVYRTADLPEFEAMIRRDYFEDPIDFLFIIHFQYERKLRIFERLPSLVQHVGHFSTILTHLEGMSEEKRRETVALRSQWKSRTYMFDEDSTARLFRTPFRAKDGYIGCFRDSKARPDLLGTFSVDRTEGYSPGTCRKFCAGFPFMGIQRGGDCYCGTEFGRYGRVSDHECDTPCQSDPLLTGCGAQDLNSVYRVNV